MATGTAPLLPRSALNPDLPLTVSQWADTYRVLSPLTSAEPGQWHTDRTPYLREMMDSFGDPEVEEVTLRCATQIGKTETILNCLGYLIDYDPAPTMIVLPRDDDAKAWGAKRVAPMVKTSPALLRHTTGKEDDLAGKTFRFDRMLVKFAGANSPADLAGDPIRYVFFDETDKYPKFSGRESDPISLGKKRTETFWNKKIIKASTPTTPQGYISQEYEKSDKRRYYTPCPFCGTYQPLTFRKEQGPGCGHLWWPEGATPEDIISERLAQFQCGFCSRLIGEEHKPSMLAAGAWCPDGCTVDRHGRVRGEPRVRRHRGYHLPALYSPWKSWSEIAGEFLDAKETPAKLMAFVNSVLAEPWIETIAETKEDHLRRRCQPYPPGLIPAGGLILTGGVDVQADHYYYVIRAWGLHEESWLILYGRAETEADLEAIFLQTEYPVANGGTLPVRLVCQDSGSRTDEVYRFCRKHAERFRPIKGWDHLSGTPYRASFLEKDARGQTIRGGLTLYHLDTAYYKDKLNRLIHAEPGALSGWHLPEEVSQDYLEQMTAEHKVLLRHKRSGSITYEWQPITERRANHYWDCEVYALAAAEMLRVYLLRPEGEHMVYQPHLRPRAGGWLRRAAEPPSAPSGRGRSGWLRR